MVRIVLHQWEISPFCHKVRKILQQKQFDYTVINYNGLKATQVAQLSRVGKLPVLEYGTERIQDSSDIAEFLEAKRPSPSLYPANEADRSYVHFWEDWADESLYWYEVYFRFMDPAALKHSIDLLATGRPAVERWMLSFVAPYLYRNQLRAQGLGRMEFMRVEQKFFQHIDHLEHLLKQQDWLVGHQQTIADIAVSAQLEEILRTSSLRKRILVYSHLSNWLQRQR